MTRRILLAMLAVAAVLILGVALPLGIHDALSTTRAFEGQALDHARVLAGLVEETRDRPDGTTPAAVLPSGGDDVASIIDGAVVPLAGRPIPLTSADLAAAADGREVVRRAEDAVVVVVPLDPDHNRQGALALSRPTAALGADLRQVWLVVGGAGVGALALSVLLSVVLARWVARPLDRLEVVADRIGGGDLASRADAATGPAEVRALATTVNEMATRIESLLGAQRAMVEDVTHQLRTPLAAMRLRLELLGQDVPAESRADVAAAEAEVDRLSRLVDGLLAVARAEARAPDRRPVAVADVLHERAAAWEPVAADRGQRIAVLAAPTLTALATPGHLEQVLDNLLANAIRANPPGGTVRLTATDRGGTVRLTVSDQGPGMSAEQRQAAFDRFWRGPRTAGERLDRAAPADGGSGLGLAIVSRLVLVDGGTARLDEAPGGGLAAVVELPGAARPARDPGRRGDVPGVEETSARPGRPLSTSPRG